MPLTRDGERHKTVDEMIEGLVASQKTDLLPMAYLLASLVFQKKGEREWLDGRFTMYQDILEESWVYQKILREGIEEGREETLRQTLISFMETRFPTLVTLTKQQTDAIKSSDVLQSILNKMFSLQTIEEAEQYLLTLSDDAKKN